MNEEYKKKLIVLAKEVQELNKPKTYISSEQDREQVKNQIKFDEMQFNSKLNYLLGYIMALDNDI